MAESSVRFLLDKLDSSFENDKQLVGGVREEIVYLRGQLEYLRAFLTDADALEESDEELRAWVRLVREIAHDAEDTLDELRLLQSHDHGDGIHGVLCRLSCCIKRAKARYRIASQLRGINATVKSICDVHKKLRDKYSQVRQGWASSSDRNSWRNGQSAGFLPEKSVFVGVEELKQQLISMLLKGSAGREVVSVVGTRGLGKTTLARQVYDDEQVNKHFKARAWLRICKPFKLEVILKAMVRQLFFMDGTRFQDGDRMNNEELKKTIKYLLEKRRYLIVIDDVSYLFEWYALKHIFPDNNYGSRVMLVTRDGGVAFASSVESEGQVYNLKPLTQEQSWDLFCKKTFQGSPCPPHLENICASISKKCEGLPLAIAIISGLLATKDTRRIDEWDTIQRSLEAEIRGIDKLQKLRKILSLSFNDLPYYLKSCFLYLSIFPEHSEIEHMRLIRLWMAEGFVDPKEGKELEDVAEDYAKELVKRNLIQVATTRVEGRVKTFRIHDLLWEIIVSKSRDQSFSTVSKDQSLLSSDKVRRLSIHNTLQNAQQNRSVSQIRSLFMFGVTEKFSIGRVFPFGFKWLKVIDLANAPLETFPLEFCDLYNLRYLSLRNTRVKSIPKSIGNLLNLETLDLKHCHVTELPAEIQKLQRLRHLLVYSYEFVSYDNFHSKSGFKTKANVGLLRSLQKLCFIEADKGSSSLMAELGKLSQLRRLGITKFRKEHGKTLCETIERLTRLRALSIESSDEDEIIDIHHLSSPPIMLQRLCLTGKLEILPPWLSSLNSLIILRLKWSKFCKDPLTLLQHLPNLVVLELCKVYNAESLYFGANGFKKLKLLDLDSFDELARIEMEVGTLPVLEKLIIQSCKSLNEVPSGIEYLPKLKRLELINMPANLISSLGEDERGIDHWKIVHIPEVYMAAEVNGLKSAVYSET